MQTYDGYNVPVKRNTSPSKQSYGTQVNFDKGLLNIDTNNSKINTMDKKIQCKSTNAESNLVDGNNEFDNNLKKCQSPVVIISVYPNQESPDNVLIIKNPLNGNNVKSSPQTVIMNNESTKQSWFVRSPKLESKKINSIVGRSRTPSPPANSRLQRKENKTFETKLGFMNVKRQEFDENANSKTNRVKRQGRLNKTTTPSKMTQINTIDKFRNKIGNSKKILRLNSTKTKETNTEHILTKKALIESYTRQIIKANEKKTRNDNLNNNESRVAVNIDAENEYYDVLFQQGTFTTDLRVKKTLKGVGTQSYDNDVLLNSMENLFLTQSEKEPRKRSLSRTLYGDDVDDIPTLDKTTSVLNIRDSLEICHRREDRTSQGLKSPMTRHRKNNTKERFASTKHYKGDNCCISDPIKRDKEIRKLLGIDKYTQSVSPPAPPSGVEVPFQIFYRRQCEKSLLTGLSLVDVTSCACCDQKYLNEIEHMQEKQKTNYKKQTEQGNPNINVESNESNETNPTNKIKPNGPYTENKKDLVKIPIRIKKSIIEQPSIYQQMILNRNIQVFLQVEQFTKKKPITLSRKQYDKVKKTIEHTISKKISHRKQCICKFSFVSVGDVRKKFKHKNGLLNAKETQTKHVNNKKVTKIESSKKENIKARTENLRRKAKSVGNERKMLIDNVKSRNILKTKDENKNTLVLFSKETKATDISENASTKHVLSSVEIRYASMAYVKEVACSSSNITVRSTPVSLSERKSRSLLTIFQGHRKSPTPNLGTSACSLYSDVAEQYLEQKSVKNGIEGDTKQKKTLLRRLMSCLVLRTNKASEAEIICPPVPRASSLSSAIDSYHISTSFAAIEINSSIYDTSASFYTNHSIFPINNKRKRSFLSSVRGFLTNRKS
ncbi:uncharacterized protein LOC116412879 [Galleria mellonella]|uniref:Uncharacterized protein LOC116412879 n=1 Tax=Galleria mellonella TaxID=7137 RepID=A0ABM3MKY6_GALME|nr:uncharacterized protein LOC116412879 [Galleria mellonella]